MEEFLELRRNYEACSCFYSNFVCSVVRKRSWNDRLRHWPEGKDICTVSDEAFALVALENSYDMWMDVAGKLVMQGIMPRRTQVKKGETRDSAYESDIPTKCTLSPAQSNIRRKSGSQIKSFRTKKLLAWSQEGIERFNYFFKEVKQDRLNHPDFFRKWLKEEREKKENLKDIDSLTDDNLVQTKIEAFNDFDDEPEQVHPPATKPKGVAGDASSSSSGTDEQDGNTESDDDDDDDELPVTSRAEV